MEASPRVFISFAGDDWEPFVKGLSRRLRENGVDAWVSYWEIRAGESLVRKIFAEGLKEADKVVVVLSETSVGKQWVREELDVATVRKIEERTSIIPVRIDGCEIPASLLATKRISIRNLQSYDVEFEELMRAIYDDSTRPPLGKPPEWVRAKPMVFSGLKQVDNLVLNLLCEAAMASGHLHVEISTVAEAAQRMGIDQVAMNASIARLDAYGKVKGIRVATGAFPAAEVQSSTFEQYARSAFAGFDQYQRQLIAEFADIPSNGFYRSDWPPPVPVAIHNAAVRGLERRELIQVAWAWGGGPVISNVSPLLADLLDD